MFKLKVWGLWCGALHDNVGVYALCWVVEVWDVVYVGIA